MKRTPIVTAVMALALSASAVLIIVMLSSVRCEDPIFTAAAAFVVVPAVCFVCALCQSAFSGVLWPFIPLVSTFIFALVPFFAFSDFMAAFPLCAAFGSVIGTAVGRAVRALFKVCKKESAKALPARKLGKKDERHVPVIKEK